MNHADIQLMIQQFARDFAREHAVHADMNAGMQAPVMFERRQKSVNGAFIHSQRQLAALEAAQFLQPLANLLAHVQHSRGIFQQQRARVGERAGTGTAHEQRLAHPVLKLAHGDADRRLGSKQFHRRARVAALARHHLKHLQCRQVHATGLPGSLLYKRDLSYMQEL